MCFRLFCKNEPFEPQLIDLGEYELELYELLRSGGVLRPTPAIPSRADRNWTDKEFKAMRINRLQADRIYRDYSSQKRHWIK